MTLAPSPTSKIASGKRVPEVIGSRKGALAYEQVAAHIWSCLRPVCVAYWYKRWLSWMFYILSGIFIERISQRTVFVSLSYIVLNVESVI